MKKKNEECLSEVWETVFPKMVYIDNLLKNFPFIEPALDSFLWANISINIFDTEAKDFKKVVNKCIIAVLETKEEKNLLIDKDTITGLDFMFYALLKTPPNVDTIKIPPVPTKILIPDIVKNMIVRYRNR